MKNTEKQTTVYIIQPITKQIIELEIKDQKMNDQLTFLLTQYKTRNIISKINLSIFWFNCILIGLGLYLYINDANIIFPIFPSIVIFGLFNAIYLKKYNDWQELSKISKMRFDQLIYTYTQQLLKNINQNQEVVKKWDTHDAG